MKMQRLHINITRSNNSLKFSGLLLTAFLIILPGITSAQNGKDSLYQTNINAFLNANGLLFWNDSAGAFEAPKGQGRHTISAASLWIGGLDKNKQLHLGAQTYRETGSDFWPGPLDTVSGSTDSVTSQQFNKIWRVTKLEVDSFLKGLSIPVSILNWPANGNKNAGYSSQLAPYVDVDQDGVYSPANGDYPAIKGDVSLWWVYNDNLSIHSESTGLPLGVEIQCMAYTYNCQGDPVLNNSIFIDYKIINRSAENYDSVYIGLWSDFDIGNLFDDYIGSIPSLNSFYAYNADKFDNDTTIIVKSDTLYYKGYSNRLPVQGVTFLDGPADDQGKQMEMSNFMYYNNEISFIGNPALPEHYYNYLKSKWFNGNDLTASGTGYGSAAPTNFAFDGDPVAGSGWNELSEKNKPFDRRGIGSFGPFTFNRGDTKTLTVAFIFALPPSGNTLAGINLFKKHASELINRNSNKSLVGCTGLNTCSSGDTCVWPGDVNADGKANMDDIFRIGLGFGETGPVRPFNSLAWVGQTSVDWNNSFVDGLNYKFADANGDGIIDSSDILAIVTNYSLTHNKNTTENSTQSGNPVLALNILEDSVVAGKTVTGTVKLGTPDNPALNVYGIVFTINYDTAVVVPGSIEVSFNPNALGEQGEILVLEKDRPSDGQTDIGIVRNDKKGKNSDDIIITLKYVIDENVGGVKEFGLSNIHAIDSALNQLQLEVIPDSVKVISSIFDREIPFTNLKIFPNPATDFVKINLGEVSDATIKIMNLQGQTVNSFEVNRSYQVLLNTSRLPTGIYFIEVSNKSGKATRKFIKMN